jgi:hypothetical protein
MRTTIFVNLDARLRDAFLEIADASDQNPDELAGIIIGNWLATNATTEDVLAVRQAITAEHVKATMPGVIADLDAKSAARIAKQNPSDAEYKAALQLLCTESDEGFWERNGMKRVEMTTSELAFNDATKVARRRFAAMPENEVDNVLRAFPFKRKFPRRAEVA